MTKLTEIKGIGSRVKSKLNSSDVTSVEELASSDPSDLENIGEVKAEKIIRRANQETITSQTVEDMLDDYENQTCITTGVDGLDDLLDGGWEPETIGMLYGQSGTGKTQVLFSSMGAAASEGPVVYLMTEVQSKSIADRIKRLSSNVDDLSNIHIYQANDVDEQYESYHAISEDFDEISLLVIDSFTAQFRMNPDFDGRENYGARSAAMGKHLRQIGRMSRIFKCPVVMTGQVYESPDMFGKKDQLYGGQKMEHFVSYFVRMRESEGVLKEATIENHAGIEEDDVKLTIEDDEIREA